MDFFIWLKETRKERGLSQQEMADWLNAQAVVEKKLDNHSIFNWENRRTLADYLPRCKQQQSRRWHALFCCYLCPCSGG